jgi:hypothetical protein
MIKLKYKGRSFSSARALAEAMQRDLHNSIERQVRSAASINGLTVRKTSQGFEVSGEADKIGRLYNRLGR